MQIFRIYYIINYSNTVNLIRRYSFLIILKSFIVMLLLFCMPANSFPFSSNALDLKISGTISETYDDNLTFEKDNKKEDFITTLGLGVGITHEGKRRSLSFNGNLNQRFNAKFSDIKSSSENLNIVFNQELSKYSRIRLTDIFSHSRFPSGFEEEFGRVAGRRESYNNNVNLYYVKEFSERINMNTSYTFSQSFFPDESVNDSSSNSFGFNVGYRYGISSTISLSSSYSSNNFGNSIYSAGVGIKQQVYITKKSFFTGNVGLKGNSNDNIGLNINVNYTTDIDERTFFSFKFNTSDQLTDEGGEIFDNWRLSANFTRDILEKLMGSIAINYAKGTFSSTDITDTLLGSNSYLSYSFTESLRGSINYSLSNLDSTEENRKYMKNVVYVNISKTL